MEFRLLGPFEVWDGGQQVEIAGSKQRALLALLVLRANEVVRTELLVDELWGERPPRNASAALHTHVSRLRKTLGADTIASREWGYVLRAAPEDVDLSHFESLVAEAEPLAAEQRATKLAEGLALWRGPPLADLVNEPALAHDIGRLEELRLGTLERRIDADLEAGQSGNLVGELEALIARNPLREHLRWLLILALYRAGRQAEALEVYRETRRVLTEELGIEPSPELRELERAILQHDPALRASRVSTPVVAEPGVRPVRRRRVLIGASIALLVAGLGVAAAYALSTRTSHAIAQTQSTSISPGRHSSSQTEPRLHQDTVVGHTPTAATTPAQKKTTTTKIHAAVTGPAATHTGATTTHTTKQRRAHPPKTAKTGYRAPDPVRVADDFSSPTLDPAIWTTWSGGTGSSYTQANGRAVFSIAADATFEPQYDSAATYIGTQCRFPGDFDARVHFSLLQWPAGNGATIDLTAYEQDSELTHITRMTTKQFDGYTAWPNPYGASGTFALANTSGALRIKRSHGVLQDYIWYHGRWKKLWRRGLPKTGEIWFSIGIVTFQPDWQQQDVSAAFDNFKITAPNGC